MSERREIIMRRRGDGILVAVNYAESDALQAYPEGKDLWVSIRRKRSIPHHAKYWAILQRVVASGAAPCYSEAKLHKILKFLMGHYTAYQLPSGEVIPVEDSISFRTMDQTEFNKFYDEAMRLLSEKFGINPEELE